MLNCIKMSQVIHNSSQTLQLPRHLGSPQTFCLLKLKQKGINGQAKRLDGRAAARITQACSLSLLPPPLCLVQVHSMSSHHFANTPALAKEAQTTLPLPQQSHAALFSAALSIFVPHNFSYSEPYSKLEKGCIQISFKKKTMTITIKLIPISPFLLPPHTKTHFSLSKKSNKSFFSPLL